MKNYTEKEIAKLQDNLLLIRRAGGWSATEFGDMIGVTKQTISNLENKKTVMTKTQYIAIRAVLDYEISSNPENEVLSQVVNLLLNADNLSIEDREKAKNVIAFVSGATTTGLEKGAILSGIAALMGAAALEIIASPVFIEVAGTWLAKILKTKDK